jgi:hypothetical protein
VGTIDVLRTVGTTTKSPHPLPAVGPPLSLMSVVITILLLVKQHRTHRISRLTGAGELVEGRGRTGR